MRKWLETVRAFEELAFIAAYLVRISNVRKNGRSGIIVELEHTQAPQTGRTHEIELPLPVYTAGPTASLFQACGLQLLENKQIEPKSIIGHLVRARFAKQGDRWVVTRFLPAQTEADHA